MLDSSLRALAVAGLVALLLVVLRVSTSAVRHAAWTAVLAAMLLMPLLLMVVPPLGVRLSSATAATVLPAVLPTDSSTASSPPASPTSASPGAPPVSFDQPQRRPSPPTDWSPQWLVFLYALIGNVLFLRLGIGWYRARAISRQSTRVGEFFESPLVAAAVTIGVAAPRIVLPCDWRSWPGETLRAVLLHERTHIQRRDPLIAVFARINCCIFWFHPLAWWLERTLATTSEHACDDAAARTMSDARAYAKVLVQQAAAVSRHRGRLAWHPVGINGAGLLNQRVDRLLQARHLCELSTWRKLTLAVSCAAAILAVAACRQDPAPPPLREDPEVARQLSEQKARRELHQAATAMTPAQVSDLEASLGSNPDDFAAREKLLIYYRWNDKVRWEDKLAARRRHLLWLIEHHPGHELTSEWGAISPAHDPEGTAQARALWLTQTSSPETPAIVLLRAANYFESYEKSLAEQMILRAIAADPSGKTVSPEPASGPFQWGARLGRLYARAIVGSTDPTTMVASDPRAAKTPFALEARQKLDASRDAVMLRTAGHLLTTWADRSKLDFDPIALGRSYLTRALEIDSNDAYARRVLAALDDRAAMSRVRHNVRAKQIELAGGEIARKSAAGERLTAEEQRRLREVEFDAALTLTPQERLAVLPDLADEAYMGAEAVLHAQKDQGYADTLWALSRKLAEEALTVAQRFKEEPAYGTVIYRTKVTLAAHALREGDTRQAVRYMLEAVEAPRSERLATVHIAGLDSRLVNYLLKEGERESVIRFLERSADLRDVERERLLKDAAALRQGVMPLSYQAMVARTGA